MTEIYVKDKANKFFIQEAYLPENEFQFLERICTPDSNWNPYLPQKFTKLIDNHYDFLFCELEAHPEAHPELLEEEKQIRREREEERYFMEVVRTSK